MSLLKKILGGTFESNREQGEALFQQGRLGEAKLAFDRALARSKGVDADDIGTVEQRVRSCKLALARAQIANADAEAAAGDIERAIELLGEAREICGENEVLDAIQDRRTKYESEDARRLVEEAEEISEDELLAIIAGTWIEPQAEEYAAMPDDFRKALLIGHDGDLERAAKLMTDVLARNDLEVAPRFAWLELGKMRLKAGDATGAIEALGSFLSSVPADEEAIETILSAHTLRAEAFARLKRIDEAKEDLIETTRLAPRDHTTFLALGVFLRSAGDYERALKAFERAGELMGQMNPDFKVIREMGFTYLAMGRKDEALERLNAVIEHLASRGEHDQFDPETAIAVARIYEEKGDPMHAADLFRHLAVGYDTKNHFTYNLEATRLLKLVGGQTALVERYLTRAAELARDDRQVDMVEKMRMSMGS
jgi:tetratricopeptide (TPR) repeat protein